MPVHDKESHQPVVLVVTSRFPSLNQPWIDTYLEQLLNHSFGIKIFTSNKNPQAYHPKVDRLQLWRLVIELDLKASSFLHSLLKTSLFHPVRFYHAAIRASKISTRLTKQYRLQRLRTLLKLMRFGLINCELDRADIIHCHGELTAFHSMLWSLMRDIPFVYTFHGLLPGGIPPLREDMRNAINAEVSRVLVNTRFAMNQATMLGCPKTKVTVIPQGLPLEEFVFAPRPCPGGDEVLHILSIGRFHRDKGYGYSLLAIARLVRANVRLHYHIVGVGQGKQRMQDFINRLDIADHVTIYEGLEPEGVHCLYEKAYLFILASIDNKRGEHVETQGVVLQEAQASGCIPIATRVGGIPECLNHEQDAILVPEKSSKAIANAVLYLLEKPEEWKRYQENGRRNVEENFSADVIGTKMAEILREVMNQNISP